MSEFSESDEATATMRDRVTGGRPVLWFLVDGNRVLVAGIMLAAASLLLVLLGQFGPGSISKLFEADPIFALFTPVIIGIIMGVSLVLTFNQLVLSQELGPIGDQRKQMAETVSFRKDVEETVERGTSPPEPSLFLRELVISTSERAQTLLDLLENHSGEGTGELRGYAENIITDADHVSEGLTENQFGSFGVVGSVLEYNYSKKIYDGRRLRDRHADSLSEDATETLEELIDALEFFGPAREHFKTLYFRWEIINVSMALTLIALPGLAVAAYMILVFETDDIAGTVAGIDTGLLVVAAAFAIGVSPFAIFLSYILRIVTVTKWTLATGPFILRETDRDPDVDET